jgi:formylglycine-generating enzyme required for sulfatase activity
MSENQNSPREYDAVQSGKQSIPTFPNLLNAAVLGGISGVKSRLSSPAIEARIAALSEALKYGEAGLDLIIQALHDESMQVKVAAYSLLKDRDDLQKKLQFQNYINTFEFDVITVDKHGTENSSIESFAHYLSEDLGEDLGNRTILEMVYIPGGTFMMGSPATRKDKYNWENPQHQVTVSAFFAGKYPITQAQWQVVMEYNRSYFRGDKRPVEMVSWDEAGEFCRKLSEKTGKSYRLLSEAEWEYACRARTSTPFYFGDAITPDLVNYYGDYVFYTGKYGPYRQQTTDVGSFPPNAFGLYDMHGNVWEWCSDKWHDNYDGAPNDGSSWETGTYQCRVQRGASWKDTANRCRSVVRNSYEPGYCNSQMGFRVALVSS